MLKSLLSAILNFFSVFPFFNSFVTYNIPHFFKTVKFWGSEKVRTLQKKLKKRKEELLKAVLLSYKPL